MVFAAFLNIRSTSKQMRAYEEHVLREIRGNVAVLLFALKRLLDYADKHQIQTEKPFRIRWIRSQANKIKSIITEKGQYISNKKYNSLVIDVDVYVTTLCGFSLTLSSYKQVYTKLKTALENLISIKSKRKVRELTLDGELNIDDE
jgi:hypothetical protein